MYFNLQNYLAYKIFYSTPYTVSMSEQEKLSEASQTFKYVHQINIDSIFLFYKYDQIYLNVKTIFNLLLPDNNPTFVNFL